MSSPQDPTSQSRSSVDKSSEHDIEKVEHHGTKRISENDAIAKETKVVEAANGNLCSLKLSIAFQPQMCSNSFFRGGTRGRFY